MAWWRSDWPGGGAPDGLVAVGLAWWRCAGSRPGTVCPGRSAGERAAGPESVSNLTISAAYRDKSRAPAGPWLHKHVGHAYVTKVGPRARTLGLKACRRSGISFRAGVAGCRISARTAPSQAPLASAVHRPEGNAPAAGARHRADANPFEPWTVSTGDAAAAARTSSRSRTPAARGCA